jgi:hypothetical protein
METQLLIGKKHAMRLSKKACKIIQLIMQFYNIDEYNAISDFYNSMTYKLLSDYNTDIWWYSVYAVFEIYKTEKETGSALNSPYIFGENE